MDMLKSVGGKVKGLGSSAIAAPVDLVNTNISHKEKVKVKFEITLKSANNLEPLYNGRNVFIEWKRGSNKERTGAPLQSRHHHLFRDVALADEAKGKLVTFLRMWLIAAFMHCAFCLPFRC